MPTSQKIPEQLAQGVYRYLINYDEPLKTKLERLKPKVTYVDSRFSERDYRDPDQKRRGLWVRTARLVYFEDEISRRDLIAWKDANDLDLGVTEEFLDLTQAFPLEHIVSETVENKLTVPGDMYRWVHGATPKIVLHNESWEQESERGYRFGIHQPGPISEQWWGRHSLFFVER